jgi:hypothetical protein
METILTFFKQIIYNYGKIAKIIPPRHWNKGMF